MRVIADTGFIVAFIRERDTHHGWAKAIAETITAPALTCEAVLAEAAFHLMDVEITLALIDRGLLKLAFSVEQHRQELLLLAKRYSDREPDLADLCLIRMSEIHPKHGVLTVDRADFAVYRRNKNQRIPCVFPPEKQ